MTEEEIPETPRDRIRRLNELPPGKCVFVPSENMNFWRYAMRKVMEDGRSFLFSRAAPGGFNIWKSDQSFPNVNLAAREAASELLDVVRWYAEATDAQRTADGGERAERMLAKIEGRL